MPYKIKGKCVYKKDTGEKVGCTKGSVKDYLAGLHMHADESKGPADMKKIIENFKHFLKEETEFIDDLAWPKKWVDEQREIAVGCKQMECSSQDIKRMLKGRPIVVPELEWLAADEQKLKDNNNDYKIFNN